MNNAVRRQLLGLPQGVIDECHSSAAEIAQEVERLSLSRTTTGIERAALRLLGLGEADEMGVPLVNRVVDKMVEADVLQHGVCQWLAAGLSAGFETPRDVAEDALSSEVWVTRPIMSADQVASALRPHLGHLRMRRAAHRRRRLKSQPVKESGRPRRYVIAATGRVTDDIRHASVAFEHGADVIAVLRSSGQSLLDHVPVSARDGGFGGTWATDENMALMRSAVDRLVERDSRYVELAAFSSGLCMAEISVLAIAREWDVLVNDATYGIFYRDIDSARSLVDQHFSRRLVAHFGLEIHTGENNYLRVEDAREALPSVIASQFINHHLCLVAGIDPSCSSAGLAFEVDPNIEQSLLYEIAHALVTRELWPNSKTKFMPPTKWVPDCQFGTHTMNVLATLVAATTGQDVHTLGMSSESGHVPRLDDRRVALGSASYIDRAAAGLLDEIQLNPEGLIVKHANDGLSQAKCLLTVVASQGLVQAIGTGVLARWRSEYSAAHGADGVMKTTQSYVDVLDVLKEVLEP